jgi:DNA adenine methylase
VTTPLYDEAVSLRVRPKSGVRKKISVGPVVRELARQGIRRMVISTEVLNEVTASGVPLRPFIKWAGGKTRLLPNLLPYVPDEIRTFREPFLGGGAMFFALRDRLDGNAQLSDLNEDLVLAWSAVQASSDELFELLEDYKAKDSEEFFYFMRPLQPEDTLHRAARFIYLNQTSWNGLWRVNGKGVFNVPWGERPFRGIEPGRLQRLSQALGSAQIRREDFRESLERAVKGDFVYLDPPYLPKSETSKFCFYTKKRFTAPDLEELAALTRDLTDRGVSWMLSNRDNAQIRELFDHAEIVGLTTKRSVAAQNRRDVESVHSPEVIILGGG